MVFLCLSQGVLWSSLGTIWKPTKTSWKISEHARNLANPKEKNKNLATQYANSSSSSEQASYKSQYDSNASEMKSFKSAMQTWDMLTLIGLGWEAYLYFSDDSKETAVNYRNSSFTFIPSHSFGGSMRLDTETNWWPDRRSVRVGGARPGDLPKKS